MSDHRIHPHGELQEIATGVWLVEGRLPIPITRNMIVVRLPSGELLLHSVIALSERGMKALEALGRPAFAIIPSKSHVGDAGFYKARYPDIQMLAVKALRPEHGANVPIDADVEDVLPRFGIVLHPVPATKAVEYVYEVPLAGGGRMLIANDVLGNVGAGAPGLLGSMLTQFLLPKRDPEIARIYRLTQAKDVAAIRRFLSGLGGIPDLRLVTVSHGAPIRDAPAAKLKALAP